ncbi:unnamed protein product [Spirodela intermedia]|uniref:Uncharacterized protein n=1 Tax=Spirodela intermedia TaxID=51605 RepID=A0A7I8KVV0_SPIIN|nr:unnamed protein product [Spirodela intermedia]
MGLLLSCWFIVGTILIPNGFARWNQLSFFVHPVLLVFCELFLISKYLVGQVIFVLVYPFRVVFRAILFVFRLLRSRTTGLVSLVVDVVEVSDEADESAEAEQYFEAPGAEDPTRSAVVHERWGGAPAGVGSSPRSVLDYYERFFPGVSIDVPDKNRYSDHRVADEVYEERPQKGKRKRRDSSSAASESGPFLLEPETEMDAEEVYNAEPSGFFERESDDGEDIEDAASLAAYQLSSRREWLAVEESGRDFTFPHIRSRGSRSYPKGLEGVLERERDEDHFPRDFPVTVRRLEGEKRDEDHHPWASPVHVRRLEDEKGHEDHVLWCPPVPVRRLEDERRFDPEEDGDSEELEASEEESAQEDPPLGENLPAATSREKDADHEEYEKRMKWFDRVNYERTRGASEILNIRPGNPSFLRNVEVRIRAFQGMSIQSLLKSIEDGLEMVYVSQTCLSWEALHRQYCRATEALVAAAAGSSSGAGQGVPCANTISKFQRFVVLLERYMENENKETRRFWNYSQGRISDAKFLQVPEISGDERRPDGTPAARQVVAAVEKAVQVFWSFLRRDDHRAGGILKKLLWVDPQAEDPRDLNLLDDLKKVLRKKEKQLKKLQGSRSAARQLDSERMETLFATIDIKLVARVLRMSVISTQQLEWCRQKLAQVEIGRGNVLRARGEFLPFPFS